MTSVRALESMLHGLRASRGVVAAQSGLISLVLVMVFIAACVALQWLRPDLDWRLAPMSRYLRGPYGGGLRMAYYGLGFGLAVLGQGLQRATEPHRRSTPPQRLLWLAGLALVVTAITETDLLGLDRAQALRVHQLAALVTFVSVTLAMLLQSWRFQAHAAWRPVFRGAFALAIAAFVALGVYATGHGLPHALEWPQGILQKAVITLIVAWLALAAWRLRRLQAAGPRAASG